MALLLSYYQIGSGSNHRAIAMGAKDSQWPLNPGQVFELLSEKSLANIRTTQQEALVDLLAAVSQFCDRLGVSTTALKKHDPSDLFPAFEQYAERQYNSYAEELLFNISNVDHYEWYLITDVTDRISNEIRPKQPFLPTKGFEKWTELEQLLRGPEPALRQEVENVLVDPNGDWELYTASCFNRQLRKQPLFNRRRENSQINKAVDSFILTFQLKYICHLRLFKNWLDFDYRLRAHLSHRPAYWKAEAFKRATLPVPTSKMTHEYSDPRAVVEAFISKMLEAGREITRKQIWTAAGYKDATEFERFQRGAARTTRSAKIAFERVLSMSPEKFMEVLDNMQKQINKKQKPN